MKILQHNSGLLTSSEVLQVLHERGCDSLVLSSRSLASEKMVHQYLQQHSAGLKREDEMKAFIDAVKPYNLTRIEVLQLINLVPTSVVEIHLIVEACEERLSEEQIEELLQIVNQHLPKPPAAETS